jgi:hypothetical protein
MSSIVLAPASLSHEPTFRATARGVQKSDDAEGEVIRQMRIKDSICWNAPGSDRRRNI